jgi:dTDP-4-dehydrorhamnose reductase
MRILVLGGDGMLGHQLLKSLSSRHEVKVTLRQNLAVYQQYGLFVESNSYAGIDVRSFARISEVMADFQPDAVINAVGIVKQRIEAKESIPSIEINALLPHRLSVLCRVAGVRLIHLSTDCVFSGKKGNYRENDPPDADDLYGRSKYLGEVHESHCLTLRTSIIGYELSRKKSLLEWFLSQTGTVKGFTGAIYSGFTTKEMSRIIEMVLLKNTDAHGLYHVTSDPINKYDLLLLFRDKFDKDIEVVRDGDFVCDRSMDSARFRRDFDYVPPTWDAMIAELAKDSQK